MEKVLKMVDDMIDKIPAHIRDIIQKASLALLAVIALVAILTAIAKGVQNADPAGEKLIKQTDDLFYIEKLRQENLKRHRLIEDVPVDEEAAMKNELPPPRLAPDKTNRLLGEKGSLLEPEVPLGQEKNKEHSFLEPESDIPNLPDEATRKQETLADPELLPPKEKPKKVKKTPETSRSTKQGGNTSENTEKPLSFLE